MQTLGDGKEVAVTTYHLPVSFDTQGTQEWDVGNQEFGDPTPEGCGVDVAQAQSLEFLPQTYHLIDKLAASYKAVFVDIRNSQGDFVQH